MSYELQPYRGDSNAVAPRPARRAARVISRNALAAQVRVSGTDAETDVTVAKIENATMATGTAMTSVVRVAQAQRQLEQLAPEASSRLNYLADDHSLAMGELLSDLRRNLRRM